MMRSLARSLKNNLSKQNLSDRLSRTGIRAQRRFNTQVEPLESRTMMSLAGVLTDYPTIAISSSGTVDYKAATDRFTATSVPLALFIQQGSSRNITTGRSFSLNAEIAANGLLTGGITGPDLTVNGSINGQAAGFDLNNDGFVDAADNLLAANGPLLTGEVIDFGYLEGGNNDLFDFRVKVTGGQLANLYTGDDVGIRLTSSSTTSTVNPFTGNFNADFNQQAEGVLGGTPKAAPGINIVKLTNGTDNNTGTGPVLVPGSPVTWTYQVTNTGNVRVKNVAVTDDNGTPGNTGDDFAATYVSGDTDNDGMLGLTETWIYTAPGTSATGQYENTGKVTGNPLPIDINTNTLTDTDIDRHFGPVPGINIVKLTNGTDNNTAPGTFVAAGSNVIWTYEVSNTGNVALSLGNVIDDNGTPGNTGDDFFATYSSGDDGNGLLDTNEIWYFTATAPAVVGQYANTASVTGTDSLNQQVDDSDVDNYFGAAPGINLVKLTNNTDNNSGTGPFVAAGSSVTWTYLVTNTGNVPLTLGTLVDDNGTPSTFDDFSPSYVSGDANNNSLLDLDETWTFSALGVAVIGQYINNAKVTGSDSTGTEVNSSDNDRYFGAAPGIQLVKLTNGTDNNTPTGPIVGVGTAVTWTYIVTNTGNVPLSLSNVRDDSGTPGSTGDDFDASYVSGDTNNNSLLDTNETWSYTASGVAQAGQYTNTATVTGTDSTSTNVNDSDVDNYFGAAGGIDIEKFVKNGSTVLTGGEGLTPGFWKQSQHFAQWYTYTTTQSFNAVFGVSDPAGNSMTLLDALSRGGGEYKALGRHAVAALLNAAHPNIAYAYTTSQIIAMVQQAYTSGDYENIKDQLAAQNELEGDFTSGGKGVISSDPGLGIDADDAPGLFVHAGSTIIFTYTVANLGTAPLANVVVSDDNATPGNTGDDFNPTAVLSGGFNIGDNNQDNRLDLDEVWIYTYTLNSVPAGQYANIGSTVGTPVDNSGNAIGPNQTDSDAANYFGANPGINLVKKTNNTDNNAGTGPLLTVGSTVTWTYIVTNTGNVPLTLSNVRDDNGTVSTSDDFNAIFVSGDTNNNSLLDVTETWTFSAQGTAIAGQYINGAKVTGTDSTNTQVNSSDTDRYYGQTPEPTPIYGSISGTKYQDLSGNGLSVDDTPLAGTTIQLWSDTDNNGSLDKTKDTLVSSKASAAVTGAFTFSSLAIGRYFVSEVVPANSIQTGPISGYYTVNLGEGQNVVNRDFANFIKQDCTCGTSGIIYLINGERTVTDLRGNTNEGDTVTAIFTIAPGWTTTFSLVSYTAPESYFNANTASNQVIYDLATGTFGEGTHSLTVVIPNSNYQVDFVCGLAIDRLGPAGSNIFYTPQGRLISADNDGTKPVLTTGSSIAGFVFSDTNKNGGKDAGEPGIGYVSVKLTGTDNTGASVTLTRVTEPDGSYKFNNLKPGTYTVTEVEQPIGYSDGSETVGSLGGNKSVNDKISSIVLAASTNGVNYNFAEIEQDITCPITAGSAATIDFWNSSSGQALLRCLNGGSSSTNLGNWLANNFPNLYSNYANQSNSWVASTFKTLYGKSNKVEAQLLATALTVYVTDSDLAGTSARNYGFTVTTSGLATRVIDIGTSGEAFGVADGTNMTVWQVLKAVNSLSSSNKVYGGNSTLQMMAINVLTAINGVGNKK